MGFVSDLFSGDHGAGWTATNAPITQQGDLPNEIGTSQNQTQDNYRSEQSLADQLRAQSNGQGPNPAADQLKLTTDQNIQQANGLIASQKGINPALAARLAGERAADTNQEAGAQAAVMRGNQQLASEGQLAGLHQSMADQNLKQQGVYQGAIANQNNALVNSQNNANTANEGIASGNQQFQSKTFGGIMNSVGGAAAMLYDGGRVKGYDDGGFIDKVPGMLHDAAQLAPLALEFLAHGGKVPGKPLVPGNSPVNDTVPAMVSPGEIVVPNSASHDPAKAKKFIDQIMEAHASVADEAPSYGKLYQMQKELKAKQAQIDQQLKAMKGRK